MKIERVRITTLNDYVIDAVIASSSEEQFQASVKRCLEESDEPGVRVESIERKPIVWRDWHIVVSVDMVEAIVLCARCNTEISIDKALAAEARGLLCPDCDAKVSAEEMGIK